MMHLDNKDTIKLSELIFWVKKELLSNDALKEDPVPLFVIDEITVEVNFILSGEGDGNFDAVIVKAGAKVAEERVQKAIVHMKPLVPYDELAAEFDKQHPLVKRKVLSESLRVLLKGRTSENESEAVPPVE